MVDNRKSSAEDYLLLEDQALVRQCAVDTYRSHGPGGQKRNKTSSAVRLRHLPTGLAVIAVEDRSQHVNKARAVRRLRKAIALNVRAGIDLEGYEPSDLLRAALAPDGRGRVGRRDPRYYCVIGELLDVLAASKMRVRDAARQIGVSTGHLVKCIRADPALWGRVNELRRAAGVKPLR